MTDIVKRLRGKVPMAWGDEGFMLVDEDAVLATFKEAADEIDRLREIVKYYACDCDGHCDRTHDDCLINHAALGEKE